MAVTSPTLGDDLDFAPRRFSPWTAVRRNPTIAFGGMLLLLLIAVAIVGPSFVGDPLKIAPVNRLRPPSERWWFGTDQFGRDVYARTVHGARVSLVVGFSVAIAASPTNNTRPAPVTAAPPTSPSTLRKNSPSPRSTAAARWRFSRSPRMAPSVRRNSSATRGAPRWFRSGRTHRTRITPAGRPTAASLWCPISGLMGS